MEYRSGIPSLGSQAQIQKGQRRVQGKGALLELMSSAKFTLKQFPESYVMYLEMGPLRDAAALSRDRPS